MGGVGEHIDGLHGHDLILFVEVVQVARLCGGIAGDIDDALGGGAKDGLHHVRVHAGTRRVGDDHVGTAMLSDEVVGEDVLHVTGEEEGVGDAVNLGVHLGILDGLGDIFDADDLFRVLGDEVGDGARAGVEVVD